MDFRLTFALLRDEQRDREHQPSLGSGLRPDELPTVLADFEGVEASVERGSIGKGAAGSGIDLVLHVAEESLTDGAAILAWGSALWTIVGRLRRRRDRRLSVRDPITIAALATAADTRLSQRLEGARLLGIYCPTGGGSGIGTDARDVWITTFLQADGDLLTIFSSPSGLVLGSVVVPPEWTVRRGALPPEIAAQEFARLNSWPRS